MPDINELFLPLPEDLLVNLKESREVVDALLEGLEGMYTHTRNVEAAVGPALSAAYRVMVSMCVCVCVRV